MPSRELPALHPAKHPAIAYLLVLALSLATLRIFHLIIEDWEVLARWQFDILDGHAQYRAWQNRLLAPIIVYGLSLTGLSQASAFLVFVGGGLFVHNLILFGLLRRAWLAADRAIWWLVLYCFGFLFLARQFYLGSDVIDIIVFTILGHFMLAGNGTFHLTVLFLVAIANRETGLFVALYMLIDSLGRDPDRGRWAFSVDKAGFAWAAVLMGLGMLFTKLARDLLFVSTPSGGLDAGHATLGNHFYLFDNLRSVFWTNLNYPYILHTLFMLLFLGTLIYTFRGLSERRQKAVVIIFAYFASVMIFGLFNELRMLLPFLSFAILYYAIPRS